MLKHVEMDPSLPMIEQYGDKTNAPVILINLFDVDPKDNAAFKEAWAKDSAFFRAQPGYISAQLHHGIGNSRMWLNYAVFETVADFAATNDQPQFKPLRGIYPDSATAHPHLFRCVAIPGICVDKH
jgi:quinol monooxygenase YgiN